MSKRPPVSNLSSNKTTKSTILPSNKEPYYSKYLNTIYSDNKVFKEKIKNTIVKPTDPILHTNEPEKEKPISKKIVDTPIRGRAEERGKKPEVVSKSVDCLKSSYNIFFEKGSKGDEINKNLQDFTKKKKTNRKLFINENGRTTIMTRDELTPDFNFRFSRKTFPDKFSSALSSNDGAPVLNTEIVKKEHIISSTGGIMSTKKHFSTLKPSEDIQRLNDKQKLLPSEFKERYKKGENRSGSESNSAFSNLKIVVANSSGTQTHYVNNNSAFNIINPRYSAIHSAKKESKSNLQNKSAKKSNYPYVKDNVRDILTTQEFKNDYKLTPKINKNNFDILKHVPKYEWEK